MKQEIIKIFFLLLVLSVSGCLEDTVETNDVKFCNSADLIAYTEAGTNFFNSEKRPQLVTVDELNQSLGNYYIIDIRDEFDFIAGHITGAKNVKRKELLTYIEELDISPNQKIIIISSTGQLASYSSALLFIAGFENVFTLDGGMTYWNNFFSDELKDVRGNRVRYVRYHEANPSSNVYNPPDLFYESNPKTIEDKIEERIKFLLNEPDENIFISAEEFDETYSRKVGGYLNTIVIYTQQEKLLPSLKPNETRTIKGPISSILYDMPYYFTSNNFLLALPVTKKIVLYSDNGQQSSFITAYLRLLGYSARTIKYGKINMMCFTIYELHEDKNNPIVITGYDTLYCVDINSRIRDYPYEVGN